MSDCTFYEADLSFGKFNGADLTFAKLRNANLSGINLIDTDLSDADLTGAKLQEVYAEGENIVPTIAEEWLEQGKKIGREEGREEGEHNAMLKALNQTLTIRFDVVFGKFDDQLATLDLKALEQLNEVALKVNSVVDFNRTYALQDPKGFRRPISTRIRPQTI